MIDSFTSFTAVKDQTASGLAKQIIKSVKEKGLHIMKCKGQGIDGAVYSFLDLALFNGKI